MSHPLGQAATDADRFLIAWKRLEAELSSRWRASNGGAPEPDSATILVWAERRHLVNRNVADFLHSCRAARNAYVHVSFEGYDGPVTHPPLEVVYRLERILATLCTPAKLASVAPTAVTCTSSCTLREALKLMRAHDFSQLPYHHDALGWVLVTREQVSRWLEAETDVEGTALTDLTLPVRALAEHPEVGPVQPRVLGRDATVSEALAAMERALRTPDSQPGGYAAVLITGHDEPGSPRILASDDLPRLYELLGR
jgi:CBS domain-containing protein